MERNVQGTAVSLDELVNMTEVGDEIHQECNSMNENMKGPDHISNPIVKLFQGDYITNDWESVSQVLEEDRGQQYVGRQYGGTVLDQASKV